MKLPHILFIVLLNLLGTGCVTVQSWERGTHALAPMQVSDSADTALDRSIEVYREGAVVPDLSRRAGVVGGDWADGYRPRDRPIVPVGPRAVGRIHDRRPGGERPRGRR